MDDKNIPPSEIKYCLWFIQNVVLPLLPFLITAFINFLLHMPTEILGQESILIYTIILPILYLEQSDGELQKYIFWGISAVGIVLFTLAQVILKVPLKMDPKHVLHRVDTVALFLDIIYIVIACIYEAYKTFSTNRQVA